MIKALKKLSYLFSCAIFSTTVYAMDPPPADEKNSNLQTQNNLLNSSEYTDEIKLMILEPAGIANCAEVGHVSNLELVCWKWHSLINDLFTVIHKSYYLACFLHLEQFLITGRIDNGRGNFGEYFINYFMTPQVLPNLKRFKCNGFDKIFS